MLLLGANLQTLDVLAFAPHPDDAEIGAGGVLALEAAAGRAVGIVDLTRGEMASNGTAPERLAEALAAAQALGIALRENLELPDGGLETGRATLRPVIEAIRRHRPRVVLAPHWEDRHPDHVRASRLVTEAVYRAGLAKWPAGETPYRPEKVLYYFINHSGQPSFAIDVSAHYQRKVAALAAHESQFRRPDDGTPTPINDPGYLAALEVRDRYTGTLIGSPYAEGFVYQGTLALPSLAVL